MDKKDFTFFLVGIAVIAVVFLAAIGIIPVGAWLQHFHLPALPSVSAEQVGLEPEAEQVEGPTPMPTPTPLDDEAPPHPAPNFPNSACGAVVEYVGGVNSNNERLGKPARFVALTCQDGGLAIATIMKVEDSDVSCYLVLHNFNDPEHFVTRLAGPFDCAAAVR